MKRVYVTLSAMKHASDNGQLTSLIFDFKNGFLMYQVEVRKVRTNIRSSFFPATSNLSRASLQG